MRVIIAIIVFLAALASGSDPGVPPDPFGGNTGVVASGSLVTGWQAVRGELAGDHAMLGSCLNNDAAPCAQARTMSKIIDDASRISADWLASVTSTEQSIWPSYRSNRANGLPHSMRSTALATANHTLQPNTLPCAKRVFRWIASGSWLCMSAAMSRIT